MFGRKRSSDVRGEIHAPTERREGRGLGPFSSGHLTIIIVVLVITVAFPFAAFAVTGSNVFVTDATSGVHAKVNSSGQLSTQVNGAVSVGGSVVARPGAPNQLFHVLTGASNVSGCLPVVNSDDAYPQGTGGTAAMIVTGIHVAMQGGSPGVGTAGAYWTLHRYNNCSDYPLVESYLPAASNSSAPAYANQDLSFPAGLAIATDGKLYVLVHGVGVVYMTTTGYLVPTSAVPAGA